MNRFDHTIDRECAKGKVCTNGEKNLLKNLVLQAYTQFRHDYYTGREHDFAVLEGKQGPPFLRDFTKENTRIHNFDATSFAKAIAELKLRPGETISLDLMTGTMYALLSDFVGPRSNESAHIIDTYITNQGDQRNIDAFQNIVGGKSHSAPVHTTVPPHPTVPLHPPVHPGPGSIPSSRPSSPTTGVLGLLGTLGRAIGTIGTFGGVAFDALMNALDSSTPVYCGTCQPTNGTYPSAHLNKNDNEILVRIAVDRLKTQVGNDKTTISKLYELIERNKRLKAAFERASKIKLKVHNFEYSMFNKTYFPDLQGKCLLKDMGKIKSLLPVLADATICAFSCEKTDLVNPKGVQDIDITAMIDEIIRQLCDDSGTELTMLLDSLRTTHAHPLSNLNHLSLFPQLSISIDQRMVPVDIAKAELFHDVFYGGFRDSAFLQEVDLVKTQKRVFHQPNMFSMSGNFLNLPRSDNWGADKDGSHYFLTSSILNTENSIRWGYIFEIIDDKHPTAATILRRLAALTKRCCVHLYTTDQTRHAQIIIDIVSHQITKTPNWGFSIFQLNGEWSQVGLNQSTAAVPASTESSFGECPCCEIDQTIVSVNILIDNNVSKNPMIANSSFHNSLKLVAI
jgi:hypothetical protein